MNRRRFLQGTGALFCAPAIIKAENLRPIKAPGAIKPESDGRLVLYGEAHDSPAHGIVFKDGSGYLQWDEDSGTLQVLTGSAGKGLRQ